jgi:uncharacterized protein (DUF2267 family)
MPDASSRRMRSDRPNEPHGAPERVRSSVAARSALSPELSVDDAIAAVMCLLTERLTAGEAHDLLEALPKEVRPFFERCVVHREGEPVRKLDHAEFLDRVAEHLAVTPAHAERICHAVFEAIRAELSDEVVANVGQQLPRGLKQLWLGEPPPSAPVPGPLSDEEVRRAVEEHIELRFRSIRGLT